jgi:Reverse transcriptase (RNA-dependent DNA polymerase)
MNIILRYKARLAAQCFFQVFGVDYTDTYSPVAKFVSIRIFLAISVQIRLIIWLTPATVTRGRDFGTTLP